MNAFRPKGRTFYVVKVPKVVVAGDRQRIAWGNEPTGTRDRVTANKIDRMVKALGPASLGAWDVLRQVTDRPQRWDLAELWRRWSAVPSTRLDRHDKPIPPSDHERVEALRAELRVVNLLPLITDWHKVLTGPSRGISRDTADHYRAAVRAWALETLAIPGVETWKMLEMHSEDATTSPVLPSSAYNVRDLTRYIEEMDDVEPATVRKRGQGMREFGAWLVGRGVLAENPMEKVSLPPQGKPLCHYLETHEAQLLADVQAGQFRLFSALLAGTGLEVSVALGLRRRHVRVQDREIEAAGTKTYNRQRIVRVAEWVWPYIETLIAGKHDDALLFDAIPDRWVAQDVHNEAVAVLVGKGHRRFMEDDEGREKRYTMRDQRHTWAVRAVRSGWPIPAVAEQLGHKDGVLANRVYGKFKPTQAERDRWEQLAAARDEANNEARKREGSGR